MRSTGHPGQKKLGHGEGYIYPHDDPAGFETDHLPEALRGKRYYIPTSELEDSGAERARDELDG